MNDAPIFIHISDTHVGPKGTVAYETDTPGNLRAVARRIAEMALAPAFFVLSGDLSNHGEPASYAHLAEILAEDFAPFGVPILLGLGNHDTRIAFRQVMLGQSTATDEEEPYYYSRRIGDLRVLMLDSKIPGRVHGRLGERQLAWLDQELADPAPGGDLLVMHHPCVPRGVPRPDDYLLLDADALAQVLARHTSHRVLAILCGHSHVSTASVFGGVLHVAAPATAYLLDPSIRTGGRGVEGAGFNICTVRGNRLVINPVVLPGVQRELYRHSTTFSAVSAPVLSGAG